jgi:AcrR family transcriptional regulator
MSRSSEALVVAQPRRTRRRAPAAREFILAAARARLIALGADGLRLMDIAQDCKTSHPTILHHFGSREGLIDALVTDTLDRFAATVASMSASVKPDQLSIPELIHHAATTFEERGHASLLLWAFRERPQDVAIRIEQITAPFIDQMHHLRSVLVPADIDRERLRNDTRRLTYLAALMALGEAIFGPILTKAFDFNTRDRALARDLAGRMILARVHGNAPHLDDLAPR